MVSKLLERIRNALKPYTFEDYVRDSNPQTWSQLKEIERTWNRAKNDLGKMY